MGKWKTIAIIFIILFTLETAIVLWGVIENNHQTKNMNTCYYDFCSNYSDAYYVNDVCTCYDYDVMGNEVVAKTKYMR